MKNDRTLMQQSLRKERNRLLKRDLLRDKQLYIMLIPFLLYYIFFFYYPMYGIQIAFRDYKPFVGIWKSPWVGLKHFRNFFASPYAVRTIRNTFLISFYSMLFTFPATVILALLMNELKNKVFKTAVQTVSYLPYFISTVVVAGLVVSFLSPTAGIVNVMLEKLGMERIYFLTKPEYFRSIIVIMGGWQGIGFGTIIYSSALCSIDAELYEAASIDGAGRWKKMISITLPCIMPTVAIMLIIRMGSLLSVGADSILLLYQPITYETGDVISTFVYRTGLVDNNYSYATAVDLLNGVIALILVAASNFISKKISDIGIV